MSDAGNRLSDILNNVSDNSKARNFDEAQKRLNEAHSLYDATKHYTVRNRPSPLFRLSVKTVTEERRMTHALMMKVSQEIIGYGRESSGLPDRPDIVDK